ncbi:MAG: hypothetical protein OQK09_12595 [Colwellia sp.]|nr:hypothetical protein [Colwellia sp.]MCW8865966.1 hypothetical protein [Colwellia sp.]MCW9082343.1 hypothetical protein [Colwellia sp.]
MIKIILCFCLLLPCSLTAKQLSFTKRAQDELYLFNYQWLDHQKAQQEISFNLSKAALFERFRLLKIYKSEFAQKSILRAVKKQLRQTPLEGAQAFFQQQNGKMTIQVKGLEEANVNRAYQEVKRLEQQETTKYFKENYYQPFTNHDNQLGIKVNHIDVANNSVADFKSLKGIILEKVSIQNIRKVTNYVLSFVQTIPYSTLESRGTSSGSGFNPPAKLIWENQGDCDSKMTLTATLLRALMPRIDMAMVYIDEHAFIGIAVPAQSGEMTVRFQGIEYVLAEPTGPALYPLGVLAPESELAINQGRYVVQAYHSDGTIEAPEQ